MDEANGREGPDLARVARLGRVATGEAQVRDLLARFCAEAVDATGARRGFVALAEAEAGGLVLVATAGEGWNEENRRDRLADRHGTSTITSQVALTARAVRVDDISRTLPEYHPFFPGVRSVLVVPIALQPDERVRGVINLESDLVAGFTEEHAAFVSALADLAALRLAMDDLRARERALVQMGRELSAAPEPDALMLRVVAIAQEILRFEDCSLFLLDPATQRLVLAATRGALVSQVHRASYAIGEGVTGWVAQEGRPIRLRDPREHPRYKGVYREYAEEEIGAYLAVPIRSRGDVAGVIRVLRRKSNSPWFPNNFTLADQDVLETIASQVGAALDSAQLLSRLVQSERMAAWGEMSAMSSHMIGNRVFAIKGDLNELEYIVGEGQADAPLAHLTRGQVTALVGGMKKGIFRLEEILAEFRDFVRATTLSVAPLNLNELTRAVVSETFPKRGSGIVLETEYAPDALPVLADAGKLRRAFSELIENAVTFQEAGTETPREGRLRVVTERTGPGWASVTFEDSGPGIPVADKQRIFRPFFTSRNRGMGLGLAIVKGIVEAHHGAIAEVGTPGDGARFVVQLPLRDQGA